MLHCRVAWVSRGHLCGVWVEELVCLRAVCVVVLQDATALEEEEGLLGREEEGPEESTHTHTHTHTHTRTHAHIHAHTHTHTHTHTPGKRSRSPCLQKV